MFNVSTQDAIKYLTGGQGNRFAVYKDGSAEVQDGGDWSEWEYTGKPLASIDCPDFNMVKEREIAEWLNLGILALKGEGKYQVIEATTDEGLILDDSEVLNYCLTHGGADYYTSEINRKLELSIAE